MSTIPSADIVGLQFGLVTSEDVLNWSDGNELKDINPSAKKNQQAFDSVNSPLVGTSSANSLCARCGSDLERCQGHPVYMDLFQPIFNVNFFPILPKVLSCICVRCNRFLAPDDHPRLKKNKKPSNYKRGVNEAFALTSKFRTCWFPSNIMEQKKKKASKVNVTIDDNGDLVFSGPENAEAEDDEEVPHLLSKEEAKRRGFCGAPQPQWFRDEEVLIRPVYYLTNPEDFEHLPRITPRHIYNMLKFASAKTTRIFGFDPVFSPLRGMMCEKMLVSPLIIRPTRSAFGSEDDITTSYRKIQEANTRAKLEPPQIVNLTLGLIRTTENMHWTPTVARKKMLRVQGPMTTRLMRKKVPIVPACLDDYFLVQRAAATLWDSKYHKNLDTEYGRDPFSLKKRFAPGKRSKGRVRQSLLGKRGDFTARGAATPNTYNDLDEVGVPKTVCMHISWPETVNALNYNFLLGLVLNGQYKYPGCNYVERDGTQYLPTANFGGLRIGDIVHRHLRQGDWVIINRQPSLHKFAIMGYRIVVSPDNTFDSHLGITTVLGLDFDGDEENMFCPQNLLECAEIAHLMSVRQNLMKDGKLAIGFVQHAVLGAFKLTEIHPTKGPIILAPEEVQQYIATGRNEQCMSDALLKWYEFNEHKQLTGREFMSIVLPTYMPLSASKPLDKSSLNEFMGATIEQTGDMDFAADRISFLTRILERFCSDAGVSINIDDCQVRTPPAHVQQEANDIFKDACEIAEEIERGLQEGANDDEKHADAEEAEEDVCTLTGMYRDVLGKYAVEEQIRKKSTDAPCGMHDIVKSRSKGTEANITQNVIVVGQQMNESSMRYKDTTSHYYRNVLARYGFIERSFLDGLTPTEFFFHLRAARVGLISTACQTSDSGYLYRKLFKSVEDERVSFDNSVRNAVGQIILFEYGFDTTFLHTIPLQTVTMTVKEVVDKFTTAFEDEEYDDDPCSVDEIEHLLHLRDCVIEHDPKTTISVPVHFDKKFSCNNKRCMKRHAKSQAISNNAARNQVVQMWIHLVKNCRMMSSPIYELMFFEQMATSMLQSSGRLHCMHVFQDYMMYVQETLATNIATTGAPAGMDAAQSCTQPLTQSGLKRFHLSGEKTTIVTGVTRLREIINLVKNIERPIMYVYLLPQFQDTFDPMALVELRLSHIVQKFSDRPFGCEDEKDDASPLIHLTLYFHKNVMEKRMLSPREVCIYLQNTMIIQNDAESVTMSHAELLDSEWWLTLTLPRTSKILLNLVVSVDEANAIPAPLMSLKLQHALLYDKQLLAGIEGIRDFAAIEKELLVRDENGDDRLIMRKRKCILTLGSNLQAVCALPGVDLEYTMSNDIHQVFAVYGVDAAQLAIEENLMEAMQTSDASVLAQHIKLIASTMCNSGAPVSLTFSGMSAKDTGSWFKRALFEQALSSFLGCGVSAHKDNLRGLSEGIVVGCMVSIGTGGDFRMFPNEVDQIPQQPMPPQFEFKSPDIQAFLKPPIAMEGRLESEDAIRLNLNDVMSDDENKSTTHRDKRRKRFDNNDGGGKPLKRLATTTAVSGILNYTYSRSGDNILIPSSPIALSSEHSQYGPLGIIVPSSPKMRKKNERRKLRKIKPAKISSETQSQMLQFYEILPQQQNADISKHYQNFCPSSP